MTDASPQQPIEPAQPGHPEKGRLLLADDDVMFREGFSRLLRRHGYECLTAGDAAEAFVLLRDNPVDALISDIHMPGNAGLELIQDVPQIRRGLPIILLTGHPAFETAAKSLRLSVAAYLVKPPDIKEVLDLLEANIARYRNLKAVISSREQIETWARELSAIEEGLRRPVAGNNRAADYLRLTLRHITLQLAELALSTSEAADLEHSGGQLEKVELINALRETVTVLEKTRQSFKSKELGELRKRLTMLIQPSPREPGA
jgi:YesN/AraC family two-component response regulator